MLTATGLELWSPVTASFVTARRLRTLGLFDSSEAGFASVAAGFASSAFSSLLASPSATSGLAVSSVAGFASSVTAGFASSAFAGVAAGVSVAAASALGAAVVAEASGFAVTSVLGVAVSALVSAACASPLPASAKLSPNPKKTDATPTLYFLKKNVDVLFLSFDNFSFLNNIF